MKYRAMMNRYKLIGASFVLMLLLQLPVLAQGPGGPPAGPGGTQGGPIDGGVFVLVAGVAAYGYNKLRNKRKDK